MGSRGLLDLAWRQAWFMNSGHLGCCGEVPILYLHATCCRPVPNSTHSMITNNGLQNVVSLGV